MLNIQTGDILAINPEWQDTPNDSLLYQAVSGVEKGRLDIAPLGLPLRFVPIQTVKPEWVSLATATQIEAAINENCAIQKANHPDTWEAQIAVKHNRLLFAYCESQKWKYTTGRGNLTIHTN